MDKDANLQYYVNIQVQARTSDVAMANVCHNVGFSLGVPLELIGVTGDLVPVTETLET
jgi:hypothetical protein